MATNTTATATTHTGNGSTTNFAISFTFLANAEIDVTVAGVLKTLDTHYTISGSTITFTSGNIPTNGQAIKFQRDTNISAKKVDFQDGSVLTETDLDTNSDQVLFAQQEITDKLSGIEEGATGDQTNAEIRTAVEAASDSNVFTDADHSKLNAIEASATADQTAAEIRTLVESASDSNVFTDADHTKLNGIEASATADQTVSEIKSLIAGSPLDASHLAANSVNTSELVDDAVTTQKINALAVTEGRIASNAVTSAKIADDAILSAKIASNAVTTDKIQDAELTTLAGMQSGTASKLADSTALTADIADLNQIDGMAKQTTITDDDTKFPTSGAVVDFVAAQIAPIGGLEVIANEDSFPTSQPSSGVVISISDIEGLIVNGSGVATNARTTGNGSDNVTINGFPSSLQSKTMAAGLGLMVSSTGSSQTYTYHKLLAKEADVEQLSNDINDFAARYRVGSSNPTSDLDAGDLFFNTSTQKLLVYNSTNSAWEEAQSIGNFFISTFSESFDGSRTDFTVSNAPANAQQILLSINGVVQKPNSGTSTPSEGFALSGSTVKLSSAPASGSDVFIVVMGSTVNIGTPSNNTVTSAILQNGSVIEAKLADSAITNAKVSASAAIARTKLANVDVVDDTSPQLGGDLDLNSNNITGGGNLDLTDSGRIKLGTGDDLQIYHNGSGNYVDAYTNSLQIRNGTTEVMAHFGLNGAVDIYHDGGKKFSSHSNGLFIKNEAGGTSTSLYVNGSEGQSAEIQMNADDGDDLPDYYRLIHVASDNTWRLQNYAGGGWENNIIANGNGAVELFFNNIKRFETINTGATITGALNFDTATTSFITIPHDDNLIVFDEGQKSITSNDNSGNLNFKIGSDQANTHITVSGSDSGIAQLTVDADGTNGAVSMGVGPIRANGSTANYTRAVALEYSASGANNFVFLTGSSISPTGLANRYPFINRLNARDGSWTESANDQVFKVLGDGGSIALTTNDGGGNSNLTFNCASEVADGAGSSWRIACGVDSVDGHMVFGNNRNVSNGGAATATTRLEITEVGTFIGSTSNNISDERLKKNIATISDATTKIKELKGRTFEWKEEADLETGTQYGFVAQEMESVVSDLVSDGKEWGLRAFDSDGAVILDSGSDTEKAKIVEYSKGVNTVGVIPILVEALKEAIAKIETLETKVAALGG